VSVCLQLLKFWYTSYRNCVSCLAFTNRNCTRFHFLCKLCQKSKIKGATFYFLPSQYDNLYRHLTNQPETVKPELGKLKSLPPRERKPDYLGIKVSLAKLPSTSPDLFGRKAKLQQLDDAWNDQNINVLSLVAWGGVGKTTLVNKWLSNLAKDNYRGAGLRLVVFLSRCSGGTTGLC
jgi:hypothetical protein